MIKVDDYCTFIGNNLTEHGVEDGQYVYIAGSLVVPVDSNDLYNQRVMFSIHAAADNGDIDFEKGIMIVDPKNLKKVSAALRDKFQKRLDVQHG